MPAETISISLTLLVVALLLCYKYLTWHFDVFKKLGLPGPKPMPIFGTFPSTITGKKHLVYEIDELYAQYKKSNRAIGLFTTRYPEILLLDPKLAHDVMVANFQKFRANVAQQWILKPKEDKFIMRNPFFTHHNEWKTRRTDVIGGLSLNKLNLAYPIWKAHAIKLTHLLQQQTAAGNAKIETKALCYRFTSSIMADFLWGIDVKTLEDLQAPNTFLQMTAKMLANSFETVGNYYKLGNVPFLRRFYNYRFLPEETDRFFAQLTKDACVMRQAQAAERNRMDYLNYVIQLQQKRNLTHDDAVGYLLTVLLDGYETAATVLFHTIFYLAKHMNVQEKLRAEILTNLAEDGFMSFEKLNALPYLEQCVQETLRLITPVPSFKCVCTEPTELELITNKRIPIKVGTVFTIPTFSYHHDAEYFPEPYAYKPERYDVSVLNELTKQCIFMPFGTGPRICLGMRTGLLEVKIAIVEILKQYRVKSCAETLDEKQPDSTTILMGLDGDFWLEYERL